MPSERSGPDRPHGTVTFLFTDIEGSTRLWEEHRAAMGGALERHDEILRASVAASGGVVFSTGGDGMAAAFQRAPEALEAALRAQVRLQAEPWDPPLLVRMAVHTGDVEERGGDYFGPPLNRCARLMAAGHGGQVLCSSVTSALVSGQLPDGATLRPLGTHRLRDLSDPEAVFQIEHDGLRHQFPPLRSLDSYRGNLPVQPTAFVGREREVADIAKAFDEARLVTLCGVGGVGKTRLALQVAAEIVPSFEDGAWLVELGSIGSAEAVEEAVAAALGIQLSPGRALGQSLLDHLAPRSLLLVLDNCEHLLASVATMTDAVLRRAPGLRVLATSREGLGLPGERLMAVPSLETPDAQMGVDELLATEAVRLFVERARESRSDLSFGADDARAVGELCRRLDGIPLAIELAATRVRVMAPKEIVEHLDRRFKLLTAGRRTAASRHQTLRSTIDWSYDLLEEQERTTLRRLSVFAGDFELAAAESVAADGGLESWEVSDLVFRLVDKSLVVADTGPGPTRYRLLETIRDYAWDRLIEAGEADEVAGRHCAYFLALSEREGARLRGPDEVESKIRILGEVDDIRAALRWAVDAGDAERALRIIDALALAGSLRGFWTSAAVDAAHMPGAESHPLRAIALASAALGFSCLGERHRAAALAEEALALAEPLRGSPVGDHVHCRVCSNICEVVASQGDSNRIVELARSFEGSARALDDPFEIDEALTLVGGSTLDMEEGMRASYEALSLARSLGSPSRIAYSAIVLAMRLGMVDPARALPVFAEASEAALLAQNDWVDTFSAQQLALFQAREYDYAGAAATLVSTADRAADRGDYAVLGLTLAFASRVLAVVGDGEGALLLGAWTEHHGFTYDQVNPNLVGMEHYVALREALAPETTEALARDVAALDWSQAVEIARRHLGRLLPPGD